MVFLWNFNFQYFNTLKEWACAGFFFHFILAFVAHVAINDEKFGGAVMGLTLPLISYFSQDK